MVELTRAGALMIEFTRADALMFIRLVYQSNASDDFVEQSQLLFMAISFRIVLQEQMLQIFKMGYLTRKLYPMLENKKVPKEKIKILVAITRAISSVRYGV